MPNTFTLQGTDAVSAHVVATTGSFAFSGGFWTLAATGTLVTGTITMTFLPTDVLSGTGFSATTASNPPVGFQPTTSILGNSHASLVGLTASAQATMCGVVGTGSTVNVPNNTSFLNCYLPYVVVSASATTNGDSVTIVATPSVTGNWVAATWYFNATTNHYQLSQTNPGAPWVAQNPTLALNSIFPAQGPATGGTSVQILGSGIGDGANIQIGGAPVTSPSVSNSGLITGTTGAYTKSLSGPVNLTIDGEDPTHSGIVVTVNDASATVKVINADGGNASL